MSNEKKFWHFAAGWRNRDGKDSVMVKVDNSDKCEIQLLAKHRISGEILPVDVFYITPNRSKTDKADTTDTSKWPDYTVFFTTE